MTSEWARQRLAEGLRRRVPTWQVAGDILDLDLSLPRPLVHDLRMLASTPSWRGEMNDDFDRVIGAERQLQTYRNLFPNADGWGYHDNDNADDLRILIRIGLDAIGTGRYATARSNLAVKDKVFPRETPSRAGKIKRLRFLARLEDKVERMEDALRLRHAQMQAKSRLAYKVDADACSDLTLAYIAYVAARANRRSIFMIGSQSRMKDSIVAHLENHLLTSRDLSFTNWYEVAKVVPTETVMERLSHKQLGNLIGVYHAAMADAANALSGLYHQLPGRMRAEMVMVKGVDSSRWNAYAGAMNTMRAAWLNTIATAGLDQILDDYCPGKAPRLMASDLAWYYRNSGRDLHEDTRLFATLPMAWDVVKGKDQLGRAEILRTAKRLGIDDNGWVSARRPEGPERTKPEPALVHGVVVTDPNLARTLRNCGVFSGKDLKDVEKIPSFRRELIGDDDHEVPIAVPDDAVAERDAVLDRILADVRRA